MKRDISHRIELKSKREISLMRKAGLAVWQAHQLAAEIIRPGATTAQVDQAFESHFDQKDALPLFKNYPNSSKGKRPFPAVTCASVNEAVVHGIPCDRPLKEGDIVSIDTGCKFQGWCGDAAVTYPVGQLSPEIQHLLDVTMETLDLAIQQLHHKNTWSQIAVQMAELVADNGYSTVECFVGHGIGRQMHEDPQVPNFCSRSLRGSSDFVIEPGLVIAIEPMVNMGTKKVKMLRDQWTQVTADGKPSAHFEHTVAITDEGPVALTRAPTKAELEELAG